MSTKKLIFRFHALRRMFERSISEMDIVSVLTEGKIIEEYSDDQPYPSALYLGFIGIRPLHVVAAKTTDEYIIITAYEPNLDRWEFGFEKRRS